ncbi:hypothetical protein L21SP4_02408 [Kiritimatiella glycovorans]|uniref:Uncharacterized protein n=1 Tax=Kiritimatiella glycovorans TaxID=1307763 RepID=A0A0G3EH01_9BACT|nr:hypothetical protein L21SP4_02408 [Kiritimatiella glycovorans]
MALTVNDSTEPDVPLAPSANNRRKLAPLANGLELSVKSKVSVVVRSTLKVPAEVMVPPLMVRMVLSANW